MQPVRPRSVAEFAATLGSAARARQTIQLGGAFTKTWMGGPVEAADVTISTTCLNRVLQYDPRDLTISVEAGLPYAELTRTLAEHRQMIPLDPAFADTATVGGVVASNSSGPRRRLYGTARDVIIGMKFVTLEGKVVQSGGMVVKNVAGLDMAKVMVGSFGTLAAIAVVNFRVYSMPAATRTFLFHFDRAEEACARRDQIVGSVLQPAAVDLLNPEAARVIGREGFLLAVQAGGNAAAIDRYTRELAGAEAIEGEEEAALWEAIREFTPRYLAANPGGAMVRMPRTLAGVRDALSNAAGPMVARAATGVCYAYFPSAAEARGGLIEFARPEAKAGMELWPEPGSDFAIMKKVKEMFDPLHLLNRGRLYGRI